MRPLVLTALLIAAGCAGSRELRLGREALVGTVWRETCPSPQIATAYVRLDADGRMAWSHDGPDSLLVEDVHTWTVEEGALVLRWSEGGATSRYRPGPHPTRLQADRSTFCVDAPPHLDRVR